MSIYVAFVREIEKFFRGSEIIRFANSCGFHRGLKERFSGSTDDRMEY